MLAPALSVLTGVNFQASHLPSNFTRVPLGPVYSYVLHVCAYLICMRHCLSTVSQTHMLFMLM